MVLTARGCVLATFWELVSRAGIDLCLADRLGEDLVTSSGSRLYLNVSTRCGLSRPSAHTRPTVDWETPTCFASRARLHCVVASGVVRVAARICSRTSRPYVRAPGVRRVRQPGEALLLEPAAPQQHGRHRHAELVGDADVGGALRRAQDDPAHRGALLGHPRPGHRPQGLSFGLAHSQRGRGMGGYPSHTTPIRFKNEAHCRV